MTARKRREKVYALLEKGMDEEQIRKKTRFPLKGIRRMVTEWKRSKGKVEEKPEEVQQVTQEEKTEVVQETPPVKSAEANEQNGPEFAPAALEPAPSFPFQVADVTVAPPVEPANVTVSVSPGSGGEKDESAEDAHRNKETVCRMLAASLRGLHETVFEGVGAEPMKEREKSDLESAWKNYLRLTMTEGQAQPWLILAAAEAQVLLPRAPAIIRRVQAVRKQPEKPAEQEAEPVAETVQEVEPVPVESEVVTVNKEDYANSWSNNKPKEGSA